MHRPRHILREYFLNGLVPDEGQFSQLIDSTINQLDDGLVKTANNPLLIQSSEVDEDKANLLRFSHDLDNGPVLWDFSHSRPGHYTGSAGYGLHISNPIGSRLFIAEQSGNVGIGTDDPQARLEVCGPAIVGNKTGDRQLVLNDVDSGRWGLATGSYALTFQKHHEGNVWHNKVSFRQDGKVGLGTTTPRAHLELVAETEKALTISTAANTAEAWFVNSAPLADGNGQGLFIRWNDSDNNLTIGQHGRVGINNPQPEATLDINALNADQNIALRNSSWTGDGREPADHFQIGTYTNGYGPYVGIGWASHAAPFLNITQSGALAFNTDTPWEKFEMNLEGPSNGMRIGSYLFLGHTSLMPQGYIGFNARLSGLSDSSDNYFEPIDPGSLGDINSSGTILSQLAEGSGKVGFRSYWWNGADNPRTEAELTSVATFSPDGMVGIGTENPTAPLHVHSDFQLLLERKTPQGIPGVRFQTDSLQGWVEGRDGMRMVAASGNPLFLGVELAPQAMQITSDGRVGVGGVPDYHFDVRSNGNTGLAIHSSAAGGESWAMFAMGNHRPGRFELQNLRDGGDTIPLSIEPGAPTFAAYVNGIGFVGFGTDAPEQHLHISGENDQKQLIETTTNGRSAELQLQSGYDGTLSRFSLAARGLGGFAIQRMDSSEGQISQDFVIEPDGRIFAGPGIAPSDAAFTVTGNANTGIVNIMPSAGGLDGTVHANLLSFGSDRAYYFAHQTAGSLSTNTLSLNVHPHDAFGVFTNGDQPLMEISGAGFAQFSTETGIGTAPVGGNALTVGRRIQIVGDRGEWAHLHHAPAQAQLALYGEHAHLVLASAANDPVHGSALTFVAANPADDVEFHKFVWNQGSWGNPDMLDTRSHYLDLAFANDSLAGHHPIGSHSATHQHILTVDGYEQFVGIGTDRPVGKLHVAGEGRYQVLVEATGSEPLGDDAGIAFIVPDADGEPSGWGLTAFGAGDDYFGFATLNSDQSVRGIPLRVDTSGRTRVGELGAWYNAQLAVGGANAAGHQPVIAVAPDEDLAGVNRMALMTFGADREYEFMHLPGALFGRNTFAQHVHTDDAWGLYSTGYTPLLEVQGGTGNALFTGKVGVGELPETGNFRVEGRIDVTQGTFPFNNLLAPNHAGDESADQRAQLVLNSAYSDLVIASNHIGGNHQHGSTLTFAAVEHGNDANAAKFVINQGGYGGRQAFLEFGYVFGHPNPHFAVGFYPDASSVTLTLDGEQRHVGIGIRDPEVPLHILRAGPYQQRIQSNGAGDDGQAGLLLQNHHGDGIAIDWGVVSTTNNSFEIRRQARNAGTADALLTISHQGHIRMGDYVPVAQIPTAVAIGGVEPGTSPDGGDGHTVLALAADEVFGSNSRLRLITFGASGDNQILHTQSTLFGRNQLAMHVQNTDAFGVYSSAFTPLLEIEGGTGRSIFHGQLGVGSLPAHGDARVDGRLEVTRGPHVYNHIHSTNDNGERAQVVLSSTYSELVIASHTNNTSHGSTLTFATFNPDAGFEYDHDKFVINQGGRATRRHFLDFGYHAGLENPHNSIDEMPETTRNVLSLDGLNKRVGIFKRDPEVALHVRGAGDIQQRIEAVEGSGNEAAIQLKSDSIEGVSWSMAASADGNEMLFRKLDGAHSSTGEVLRFNTSGHVSVGHSTSNYGAALGISGGGSDFEPVVIVAADETLSGRNRENLLQFGTDLSYGFQHVAGGLKAPNELQLTFGFGAGFSILPQGSPQPMFEVTDSQVGLNGIVGVGADPGANARMRIDGRLEVTGGHQAFDNLLPAVANPAMPEGAAQLVLSGQSAELLLAATDISSTSRITFTTTNGSDFSTYDKFVVQQGMHNNRSHMLDFGYANGVQDATHILSGGFSSDAAVSIDGANKRLGVGYNSPEAALHVQADSDTLGIFKYNNGGFGAGDARIALDNNYPEGPTGKWGLTSRADNSFAIERLDTNYIDGGYTSLQSLLYIDYIGRTAIGGNETDQNNINTQLGVAGDLLVGNASVLHLGYNTDFSDKNNILEFGRTASVRFGSRTNGYFGRATMGFNMEWDHGFAIYDSNDFDVQTGTSFEVVHDQGTYIKKAFIGDRQAYDLNQTTAALAVGGRLDVHMGNQLPTGLPDSQAMYQRAQMVISSELSDLVIASNSGDYDKGSTISFVPGNYGNYLEHKKFVIGQRGGEYESRFLTFGFSEYGDLFEPERVHQPQNAAVSMDGLEKRLGIGHSFPHYPLHVHHQYEPVIRISSEYSDGAPRIEFTEVPDSTSPVENSDFIWALLSKGGQGFHLALQESGYDSNSARSFMHFDYQGRARIGTEAYSNGSFQDANFGMTSSPNPELVAKLSIATKDDGYGNTTPVTLHIGYNTDYGNDVDNIVRFGYCDHYGNPGYSGDKDYHIMHRSSGYFGRNTLAFNVASNDAFAVYSDRFQPRFEVEGGSGNTFIAGDLFLGGTTVAASDARLKTNIEDLPYGLDEVLAMRPVAYNWKHKPEEEKKSLGLLAQELDPVIAEVVAQAPTPDGDQLGVNYDGLVPVLINAIKELNARLDALENRN